MAVVTISRQYGSGGREVAKRVCELLDYAYFDKQLMLEVANEVGLSEDEIVDFSEDTYKMRSFIERLFRRRAGVPVKEVTSRGYQSRLGVDSLNEARCVALVRDTILAAYERGNVVIVGRGGQAILGEKYGVLHVRLEAPLGARTLRIKEREDISLQEAQQLVRQKDAAAQAYLRTFFGIDWDETKHYHMVLNTGKLSLEATAQLITQAIQALHFES